MRITVTGLDEYTDLVAASHLHQDGVEVGILLSENPEGRLRYPSRSWIRRAVLQVGHFAAIHVCGRTARERLLQGDYREIMLGVRRIQVNGIVTREELLRLAYLYPNHDLITQHTDANSGLLDVQVPRHQLLVDGSAGRGIVPTAWVAPVTSKPVGFAGGLSPDNLSIHLPAIRAIARDRAWVDMESKLRDADDRFDLALARAAIACTLRHGARAA